jgi:hypothetical protein
MMQSFDEFLGLRCKAQRVRCGPVIGVALSAAPLDGHRQRFREDLKRQNRPMNRRLEFCADPCKSHTASDPPSQKTLFERQLWSAWRRAA